MIKKLLLALAVAAGFFTQAAAVCTPVGTNPVILIPNFNVDPGPVWAACLKYDFQVMQASGMFQGAGTIVNFSSETITGNGVSSGPYVAGYYPNAPLVIVMNANGAVQVVGQNLSTGTQATYSNIITGALGGNASYYLETFVNSPNFNVTGYSAEKSSATGIASSDSDLMLEAGLNGGLNGAKSEKIIFVTSNPVSGNIAGYVLEATANGPGAWVMLSSETNTSAGGIKAISTVTAGEFSLNGAMGLSSSCATGYYFDAQVTQGGILTGGACLLLPSTTLTHGTTQYYSTATWTTPAGISCVTLWGCAPGGAGGSGGGTAGSGAAGGGGAGEMIYAPCFPVTAGAVNTISMPAAVSTNTGNAGANGNNGITGGDLIFANAISSVVAKGGQGGFANSGNTAGAGGAGGGPTGGAGGASGSGVGVAGTSDTYVLYSSGPVVHIGGASGGGGGNNAIGGIGGPSTRQGGYLGGLGTASSGAAYAGGGGGGGGGFTGIGGYGGSYTNSLNGGSAVGYCSGGGGGVAGPLAGGPGGPGYLKISW